MSVNSSLVRYALISCAIACAHPAIAAEAPVDESTIVPYFPPPVQPNYDAEDRAAAARIKQTEAAAMARVDEVVRSRMGEMAAERDRDRARIESLSDQRNALALFLVLGAAIWWFFRGKKAPPVVSAAAARAQASTPGQAPKPAPPRPAPAKPAASAPMQKVKK